MEVAAGAGTGAGAEPGTLPGSPPKVTGICNQLRHGWLPLLVQLIHPLDAATHEMGNNPEERERYENIEREVRRKACQALKSVIEANGDKKGRRETRVLALLDHLRSFCDAVRFQGLCPNGLHPGPSIAHLMKSSFDEDHRTAICELGGLEAIAELLHHEAEYHRDGVTHVECISIRRYAGMALTNLTFGDGKNKTLLCARRSFLEALVKQLQSPSEELRQVTASVLRNLSWRADPGSKRALRQVGAVVDLMRAALEATKEATLKSVLSALWNLSAHSRDNKVDICSVDGSLEFLVCKLTYKSSSNTLAIVENSGGILRNISGYIAKEREDCRAVLRERGCLFILLEQLKSPSLTVVSNACGTLWNLSARNREDQRTLWELGAVSMLRNLVKSKHKMISSGSKAALKNLLAANIPGFCPNVSNALGTDGSVTTLQARKLKALRAELDESVSETCDNIESPKNSPTHVSVALAYNFKSDLVPDRMFTSISGPFVSGRVSSSSSRDSIASTHSEPVYNWKAFQPRHVYPYTSNQALACPVDFPSKLRSPSPRFGGSLSTDSSPISQAHDYCTMVMPLSLSAKPLPFPEVDVETDPDDIDHPLEVYHCEGASGKSMAPSYQSHGNSGAFSEKGQIIESPRLCSGNVRRQEDERQSSSQSAIIRPTADSQVSFLPKHAPDLIPKLRALSCPTADGKVDPIITPTPGKSSSLSFEELSLIGSEDHFRSKEEIMDTAKSTEEDKAQMALNCISAVKPSKCGLEEGDNRRTPGSSQYVLNLISERGQLPDVCYPSEVQAPRQEAKSPLIANAIKSVEGNEKSLVCEAQCVRDKDRQEAGWHRLSRALDSKDTLEAADCGQLTEKKSKIPQRRPTSVEPDSCSQLEEEGGRWEGSVDDQEIRDIQTEARRLADIVLIQNSDSVSSYSDIENVAPPSLLVDSTSCLTQSTDVIVCENKAISRLKRGFKRENSPLAAKSKLSDSSDQFLLLDNVVPPSAMNDVSGIYSSCGSLNSIDSDIFDVPMANFKKLNRAANSVVRQMNQLTLSYGTSTSGESGQMLEKAKPPAIFKDTVSVASDQTYVVETYHSDTDDVDDLPEDQMDESTLIPENTTFLFKSRMSTSEETLKDLQSPGQSPDDVFGEPEGDDREKQGFEGDVDYEAYIVQENAKLLAHTFKEMAICDQVRVSPIRSEHLLLENENLSLVSNDSDSDSGATYICTPRKSQIGKPANHRKPTTLAVKPNVASQVTPKKSEVVSPGSDDDDPKTFVVCKILPPTSSANKRPNKSGENNGPGLRMPSSTSSHSIGNFNRQDKDNVKATFTPVGQNKTKMGGSNDSLSTPSSAGQSGRISTTSSSLTAKKSGQSKIASLTKRTKNNLNENNAANDAANNSVNSAVSSSTSNSSSLIRSSTYEKLPQTEETITCRQTDFGQRAGQVPGQGKVRPSQQLLDLLTKTPLQGKGNQTYSVSNQLYSLQVNQVISNEPQAYNNINNNASDISP